MRPRKADRLQTGSKLRLSKHRRQILSVYCARLPSLQNQLTPAEIDWHFVIDEQRGRKTILIRIRSASTGGLERLRVKSPRAVSDREVHVPTNMLCLLHERGVCQKM